MCVGLGLVTGLSPFQRQTYHAALPIDGRLGRSCRLGAGRQSCAPEAHIAIASTETECLPRGRPALARRRMCCCPRAQCNLDQALSSWSRRTHAIPSDPIFTLHIELTRLPHSASVQQSCGKVSSMTCLEHTTLGENTHAKQLFHRASMVNAVALMSVAA